MAFQFGKSSRARNPGVTKYVGYALFGLETNVPSSNEGVAIAMTGERVVWQFGRSSFREENPERMQNR